MEEEIPNAQILIQGIEPVDRVVITQLMRLKQ